MDPNDLRPQYDPEETRIDPADGNSYTKQDFIDAYNGTDEWEAAAVQPADPGGAEPGAESGPVAEPEPESELAEVEAEPESEPEPALEPEPEPAEAEAEVGVEAEVEAESEPELAADPEAEPQAELEADLKLASGEEVEPEEAGPGQLDQPDTAEAAGPLRGRGGVSTKAEAERVVESEPEQVRDSEPESELAPGQGPEEVAPAGAADASEIEAMRQSMRKEAAVALEAPDAAAALEATAAVAVETEAAGSIPAPGASAAPQAAAEEAGDGEPLATHAPKDRERSVFGLLQSIVEAVPPSTPRNAHAARYSEISARRIAAVASGRRLAGYPPPPLGSLPTSIVQREPPGSADEAAAAAGGLAVAELEKLSAGELRALLGAMGLTVGGRKRELIGRLRDELDGRVDAPPTALSTPIACGHQRTSPRGARGEGEMALVPTPPSEHRARRPTPPSLLPKSPFSPAARRLGSGGEQVVDAGGGGGGAMGSGGVVGAVLAAAVGQGGRRWDLAAEDEAYDRAWEAMAGRKSAEGAARGCSGESSGNKDTRGGGGGRAGGDTTSRSDRSMDRSAGRNTGRAGPTGQLSSRSLLEQLPAAERRELELLGELSGTIGLGSGEGAEDRVALDREEERRWVGRQEAHRSLGESPQEAGASESGAGGSGVLTVSERTRRQILEDPAMAARYARSRRRRDRKDEELNPAQKLARKMQAQSYRTAGHGDWGELFSRYDRDQSGFLDFDEFRSAVRRDVRLTPAEVSDRQLRAIFRAIDKDGGGGIEANELFRFLERADARPADEHDVMEEVMSELPELERAHRPWIESGYDASDRKHHQQQQQQQQQHSSSRPKVRVNHVARNSARKGGVPVPQRSRRRRPGGGGGTISVPVGSPRDVRYLANQELLAEMAAG